MPLQPLNFTDYAPDLDPLTPDIVLDCNGVYPVEKGFRTLPGLRRLGALPATCVGAFSGLLIGDPVTVAGTAEDLYVLRNGVFVPQGLGVSGVSRWSFAQYGKYLIAANGVTPPFYYSVGMGNFQPLTGNPPVASLVSTSDYAVFLALPNSQTVISNLAPTASWQPNIATEVFEFDLGQIAGDITAIHRSRSLFAVYRRNALQCGTIVGGQVGWDWTMPGTISLTVGAAGQGCVVNIGDFHYIFGPDDFYTFDGFNLVNIPNHLKEWVFRDLNQAFAANIAGRYDVERDLVFWHYPSQTTAFGQAGGLDSYVCLYRRTGKWAFGRLSIETPLVGEAVNPEAGPNATNPATGVVLTDHSLNIFDDAVGLAPVSSVYVTSHDFGDRQLVYQCRRVMPGFSLRPVPGATGAPAARLIPYTSMVAGQTPAAGSAVPLSDDGWFNFVTSARLQRFRIEMFGPAEITHGWAELNPTGEV